MSCLDHRSATREPQTIDDPTLRACLLRLKLYVHDFDQSLSPDIISRCRGLLVLAQVPVSQRSPYLMETNLLEALLAIRRLCHLATLSKAELERDYCSNRGDPKRAVMLRKLVTDLLIVVLAVSAEFLTQYLSLQGDCQRATELSTRFDFVAKSISKVTRWRHNNSNANGRRAKNAKGDGIKRFLLTARQAYAHRALHLSADNPMAPECRLVNLAMATIDRQIQGSHLKADINPLMKTLLADLQALLRWSEPKLTPQIVSDGSLLIVCICSQSGGAADQRAILDVAERLSEQLQACLNPSKLGRQENAITTEQTSGHDWKTELLCDYIWLVRDMLYLEFGTCAAHRTLERKAADDDEEAWIMELRKGAIADMT